MSGARNWNLLAYVTARLSALLLLLLCLSSLGAAHGDSEGPLDFLKRFSGPFNHTWELWAYSLSSTLLISAAPFFILFFIPLDNAMEHSTLLKVLLSFASGGLLGDAFLHLIPHATSPHGHHSHDHSHEEAEEDAHHHGDGDHVTGHDHAHSHDHMQDMIVGLWVLGGIVTFLIVEKFVRLAKGQGGHGHSHGAVTQGKREGAREGKSPNVVNGGKSEETVRRRKKDASSSDSDSNTNSIPAASHPAQKEATRDIKVAGYLNLAADFTHNFTDGLAIGASFLAGKSVGFITTVTILFHEVPHEIGDFAILIQSGVPKRKAIMLQLVTAVGALAGTVCGLLAEGVGSSVATSTATAWILPFTAGGFIYIATVSVIPELLEDSSLKQSVMEVLAIFVGIGMMVVIGFLE